MHFTYATYLMKSYILSLMDIIQNFKIILILKLNGGLNWPLMLKTIPLVLKSANVKFL